MTLKAALAAEQAKSRRGPRCTLCEFVDSLTGDDLTALKAALADDAYTSAAIARALRSEGHGFAQSTVMRHRKGECAG